MLCNVLLSVISYSLSCLPAKTTRHFSDHAVTRGQATLQARTKHPLDRRQCTRSRGAKWIREEERGTVPIWPVLGFHTTSMEAFSGFSPFLVPGLGPYTAASTTVSPCAHRAEPWARWSGFPVQENGRSWFGFRPSARLPPSIIPSHSAPGGGAGRKQRWLEP
jgi:hypothetical protein